jgi:PEP-CTERM motif
MKRLIATAALGVAGLANAANLSWTESATGEVLRAFDPAPDVGLSAIGPMIGDFLSLGALSSTQGGFITFTFLGQESGYTDRVDLIVGAAPAPMDESLVGSTVTAKIGAGVVDFKFFDAFGGSATNGGAWLNGTSIALLGTDFTTTAAAGALAAGSSFSYVLGFNDSATSLDDWDDYVIGVNITPVPEPSTYALMFAGLAAVGFVARRRSSASRV